MIRKRPKILAIYPDESGCTFHRIKLPFFHLNRNGYVADWIHKDRVLEAPLNNYDIYILPRTGPDITEAAWREMKTLGKVIITEWDDDLVSIPDHNPASKEITSDVQDVLTLSLANSTAVTVTTEYLADVIKKYNSKVWTLPNCVDPSLWDNATKDTRKIEHLTIGWFGGDSHAKDLALVKDAVEEIARRHPKVHFVLAGYHEKVWDIPDERIHMFPWVSLSQYPAIVNQIDIGLCPLVDDHFNRSKSPLKALEYGVIGIPVIASPVVYPKVINHSFSGYLAYTTEDWVRWIIVDP